MLLDDTQECIYYGRGQVLTYDQMDEFQVEGFKCPFFKNMPRKLLIYDWIVEDTGIKLFKLRRITDVGDPV